MSNSSAKRARLLRLSPPAALSALILIGAFRTRSPLVAPDPLSGSVHASLRHSSLYSVLAPLSNLFDALTLQTIPQFVAMFGFVAVLLLAWRAVRAKRLRRETGRNVRIRDELRFVATMIGAIIALGGLTLLLPRPMAAVKLDDPDLLTIDFHSHTSASHDGRPSFTPDANREWHRSTGFDVAYISDHFTSAGAVYGERTNGRTAGEGTVLLSALELRDDDEHVIALGLDPARTNPDAREWYPLYSHPLANTSMGRYAAPALLILALPGDIRKVPEDEKLGWAPLSAVELSAGSPQGFEQATRERAAIIRLADDMNLAVVAGSDNHGWTHTAGAWSVMRIPHWRAMSPAQLDAAIRWTIHDKRRMAVGVIARRTLPPATSRFGLALTAPELAWEVSTLLTWPERGSWLFWTWGAWGLVAVRQRRRSFSLARIQESFPHLSPEQVREAFAGRQTLPEID